MDYDELMDSKIEWYENQIDDLVEENKFLKEQLVQAYMTDIERIYTSVNDPDEAYYAKYYKDDIEVIEKFNIDSLLKCIRTKDDVNTLLQIMSFNEIMSVIRTVVNDIKEQMKYEVTNAIDEKEEEE